MSSENQRTEIKKANNSFKKMKQLAETLEDAKLAHNLFRQNGYHGNLVDIAKQIINKKGGKNRYGTKTNNRNS